MIIKKHSDIVIPQLLPSHYEIFEKSNRDISGKVVSEPLLRLCLVSSDDRGTYALFKPQVFLHNILDFMHKNNMTWLK